MAKRLESPSSINTFYQCQRKYYYQYIEKLPTAPTIHTIRGNIAHSCLEDFFDLESVNENYMQQFSNLLQGLLFKHWSLKKKELNELGLSNDQLKFYFEETMVMLHNWLKYFKIDFESQTGTLNEKFKSLIPIREEYFKSDNLSIRGYIDVIKKVGNDVKIIDYKTNSRSEIKESIKFQLGVYAILYNEKYNVMPSQVGAFFLRDKLKMLTLSEKDLIDAKSKIEMVHLHTSSTENKIDYKKNITPLCKWKTGQCNFYEVCKPHDRAI